MQRMNSSEVLQEIFNNAPCGLHSLDKNGFFVAINDTELNWLGYTYDELVGKLRFPDIVTPNSREKFLSLFPIFIKQGFIEDIEFELIRKDGSILPVMITSRANYSESGEFLNTNTFVINITEIRVARQQISSQKKILDTLNSIGKSISGNLDVQTILKKVTDASAVVAGAEFSAFFYSEPGDDGGISKFYMVSGAEDVGHKQSIKKTESLELFFNEKEVIRVDNIMEEKGIGKIPLFFGMPAKQLPIVSYLSVPVVSKTGEVSGGLFFGHSASGIFTTDIVEMIVGIAAQAAIAIDNSRLFEKLEKVNIENERLLTLARELDKKKNEFITVASHELKTPLTSIKGYIQLLERQFKREDKTYSYIVNAEKSINRLQGLVEDLLDVSRIQSGRLQFNMVQFDFSDLIKEAVEEVQHTTTSHKIFVNGEKEVVVKADRNRILQVLINLLNNAIKYSPGADKIEVGIKRGSDMLTVYVKDPGIGIPPDHHGKIFERFHRVPNDINFSGLGIGLYISNEIISRHSGKIWVESEPGKGSTFYFSIPARDS